MLGVLDQVHVERDAVREQALSDAYHNSIFL
jgi:hypothetical protein